MKIVSRKNDQRPKETILQQSKVPNASLSNAKKETQGNLNALPWENEEDGSEIHA